MNDKKLLLSFVSFSILPIALISILPYPLQDSGIITYLNNTTVTWLIQFIILSMWVLSIKHLVDQKDILLMFFVQIYLLWNYISISRGLFIAENYWDWKGLIRNSMALSIPIIAFVSNNKIMLQSMVSFYMKYVLPLFLVLVFLIAPDAYGFYLVPVSFLLLFLPALTTHWKIMLLSIATFVIMADLSARSNVIKFVIPTILSLIYYFRYIISKQIMEVVRKILFVIPVIFFSLAVLGIFNIFKFQDYSQKEYKTIKKNSEGALVEENLLADTRTFLYEEVLQTAKKYSSWLIGRSPARGNESQSFGEADMTGRGERIGNEAGILNIFSWTGIIGVILYFLVFYKASSLAINQSNNIFSKILGLFIAFRWMYAWVEDINNFTLNYMMLWVIIGMCYSSSFRAMSDLEMKVWVRGIFDQRYVRVLGWYNFQKQALLRSKLKEVVETK